MFYGAGDRGRTGTLLNFASDFRTTPCHHGQIQVFVVVWTLSSPYCMLQLRWLVYSLYTLCISTYWYGISCSLSPFSQLLLQEFPLGHSLHNSVVLLREEQVKVRVVFLFQHSRIYLRFIQPHLHISICILDTIFSTRIRLSKLSSACIEQLFHHH